MKVTIRRNMSPEEYGTVSGVICFASFDRIVRSMVKAQELTLHEGEYVSEVCVCWNGLEFKIEKRGNNEQR